MKYISTRGPKGDEKNFRDVLLTGLADDGGLFVPKELPVFDSEKIRSLRGLPYNELAFEIIKPFIGDCIEEATLKVLINESYTDFDHPAIAPLYQLDSNHWVMELFHGPTLAFKDFALQLLGRLLNHFLEEKGERAIVLGATSGDTGSAAIEGCKGSKNLDIFILHPHERVSEVQRRQMTTVMDGNIHNIAIKGNFDDCQEMVKQCFSDQSFLPTNRQLVAVNSINWARIMAQVVYYFHAGLALGSPDREIAFSVPTGNFGDIFAGYVAKGMGLPIHKLIVATNQNDILHRFFQNNDYSRNQLQQTLSPSMDIMVSSNFERLLFDLHQQDGKAINQLMLDFHETGSLTVDKQVWQATRSLFDSCCSDDEEICEVLKTTYLQTGYLADPHTATGIKAFKQIEIDSSIPKVTLATAHPVKFQDAIIKSHLKPPELPLHMTDLLTKEESYDILPNNLDQLKNHITEATQ